MTCRVVYQLDNNKYIDFFVDAYFSVGSYRATNNVTSNVMSIKGY